MAELSEKTALRLWPGHASSQSGARGRGLVDGIHVKMVVTKVVTRRKLEGRQLNVLENFAIEGLFVRKIRHV